MTTDFYGYQFGTAPLAEAGYLRAFGRRLLVRGVLSKDAYSGPLVLVSHSSTDAMCFEIFDVGPGVAKACEEMGCPVPVIGQHCDIRSVAADRINTKDQTCRWWWVTIEDLAGLWDPVEADDPELLFALAKMRDAQKAESAPQVPMGQPEANGAVELEPAR